MVKKIFTALALLLAQQLVIGIPTSITVHSKHNQTFAEWAQKCKALPTMRSNPSNRFKTALTTQEFNDALDAYSSQCIALAPFVQRLIVPAKSHVALHGDLHGDIHSLMAYLQELHAQKIIENFTITKPDFYLLFLGDYTDRGLYGSEVIYTIMRLKLANPTRVFLVRGNHEDIGINQGFGFAAELRAKFNNAQSLLYKINTFYNTLPVALYLGCNHQYVQCCHGGMEVGFNTHALLDAPETPLCYQLLGNLMQKTEARKTGCSCFARLEPYLRDKTPQQCFDIGFMWNDFVVNEAESSAYDHGRGFRYNKEATLAILKLQSTPTNKVLGVIRAHQHAATLNEMMQSLLHVGATGKVINSEKNRRGVSTLWDVHNTTSHLWEGIVCTLLVSPDTPYGMPNGSYPGFNYDTYATLTTADRFADWELRVTQVPVIQ